MASYNNDESAKLLLLLAPAKSSEGVYLLLKGCIPKYTLLDALKCWHWNTKELGTSQIFFLK